MVRSVTGMIVVGSFTVLFAVLNSPPPATVAVLVNEAGASAGTLTVRLITGKELPPTTVCVEVQLIVVEPMQVQPEPVNEARVIPPGSKSVTVTVPEVEAVPTFVTVIP